MTEESDMTIKQHGLIRPFALAATLAMAVTLAWGAGVSFARGETSSTYYEDTEGNLCVGVSTPLGFSGTENCTFGTLTGEDNTAVGEKVMTRNTGSRNVGAGFDALAENETGSGNTATGFFALLHNKDGNYNTATGEAADYRCSGGECKENTEDGVSALRNNETGSGNAAFGYRALAWGEGVSGTDNVGIGYLAGSATSGGANNIDISNLGVAADNGTTRVGTEGTQTRAFMAGIYAKAIKGPACTVKVNAEGQLGCKVEKVKKGTSSSDESALVSQVRQQQQEINQLASELKALRK